VSEGFILVLQQFSNPVFDFLFHFFSFFGSELFYLFFLSFIYLCLNKKIAIQLGIVIFFSMYINFTLKELFNLPRPQHPELRVLENPEGKSFPSGHAQSVATVTFFLAWSYPKNIYFLLAIILSSIVAISRIYLGVHYPRDVIVGAILGFVFALFFWYLFNRFERLRLKFIPVRAFFLSLLVGGLLYYFSSDPLSARVAGSLTGILCGTVLESTLINFVLPLSFKARLAHYGLGMVMVIALYLGMKVIFPISLWAYFMRYFFLNFWIVFVTPLIFYKALKKKRFN
jgi:membrane-associated phospholipid phosphatase